MTPTASIRALLWIPFLAPMGCSTDPASTEWDAAPKNAKQGQSMAHILSKAGGSKGIAVSVSTPLRARFSNGRAPVVVFVPGGAQAEGIASANEYAFESAGFIVVQFNFPGGGQGAQASGGDYDMRGPQSIQALADVARFAMGLTADVDGNFLSHHASPVAPATENVGFVAASNGGNATVSAAGLHGDVIPELRWIVNWESPLGDGAVVAEAGRTGEVQNPTYDDHTGTFDYSSLRYADSLRPMAGASNLKGAFYLDLNGNGVFDAGDYQTHPQNDVVTKKVYYSVGMISEATRQGLLPNPPPAHVATLAETSAWWSSRDGANQIEQAVRNFPGLLYITVATVVDHAQVAADHPHIFRQYEGMRQHGAKFVRLCPDRAYLEAEVGYSVPDAMDNDANATYTRETLRNFVNPESVDAIAQVRAAAAELADRAETRNFAPNLESTITP